MAAFNFPNSPSVNDLHTENGVTFKWNGTIWLRVGNSYSDISTLNVSGISTFNDVVNIETDDNNALNIIDTTASFRPSINFKKNDSGTVSTLMQIRVEGTNGLDIKDGSGNRRLRIKSDGKVGIGTDDPNSLVNVYSGRTSPGTSTVYPFTSAQSGTYTYTPYLHELTIHNDIRGTEGSFAGIFFRAGSDSDGQKIGAARISAVETGDYKADLVFGTRNTTFAERLRIQSDGSVGIGTDDASWGLSGAGGLVVGDGSGSQAITLYGTSNGDISFGDAKSGTARYSGLIRYNHTDDYMAFRTATVERLRITSTGRVRIGTGAIGLTNSMTAQGGLQVSVNGAAGAPTVCFGADGTAANTQTITDDTIKDCRIGFPNYDISEEPLAMMNGFVGDGSDTDSSGSARLYIGGGTSWLNTVNNIRFYTASNLTTLTGTERLRITSSGIIGVNNANPNLGGGGDGIHIASSGAAELHLTGSQGSASTDGLQIQMSGTSANIINRESGIIRFYTGGAASGNERLRIKSDGKIDVGGNESGYKFNIIDESNRTTTAETALLLYAKHDGSGTTGTGFGTGIRFWGDRASGNVEQNMGRIMCTAEVNSGTTLSGALSFETSVAGVLSERLRITSTGTVGINRSSPDSNSMLDVMSDKTGTTVNSNRVALFRTNGGGRDAHITLSNSSNTPVHIGQLSSNLYFTTNNTERLRITSDGKIGIGIASPTFAAGGGVHLKGAGTDFTSYRVTASSNTGVDFSQASDGKGYVYNRDNADLIIGTNNTERLRIDSSGSVEIQPYSSQTSAIVDLADNPIGGARVAVNSETMSGDINMPRNGCILAITAFTTYDTYPQPGLTGFVYLDMGASKIARVMYTQSGTGADATTDVGQHLLAYHGTFDTTVGNYTDGKGTIATGSSNGTFRIVNRTDNNYTFTCTFL